MARRSTVTTTAAALLAVASGFAICRSGQVGYDDTPMLPGSRYRVHDGTRPQPPKVEPGTPASEEPVPPPSDAIVLFDGTDLSAWEGQRGGEPNWVVEDGALVIRPRSGAIRTKESFGDCQLHLEFATPEPPEGSGQGRGNSGVMLFGRYEIQVLDSFENVTYADGSAAAIYGQYPPLVNASRPPGRWQTYDIIFRAPRFAEDGDVEEPARLTMLHNGVLVHDDRAFLGAVAFRDVGSYSPHGPEGPILLQDHGDPVRFRNIWVRPLGGGEG